MKNYPLKKFTILFFISFSSSLSQFQPSSPFRFAWLTDTHVGSATGEEDLRAAVRDINSMKDISFTIISGDITELGSTAELTSAKNTLDSLARSYFIIPGNHDTKWSESGHTAFFTLWKDDKFSFTFNGVRFIGFAQGPVMRMGDGHWAPENLRWFDSILAGIGPASPFFFITHYPLDSQIDNWYEATSRLRKFPVIAALVGHGHSIRPYSWDGIRGVMSRSALREKSNNGGYMIVDVSADSVSFAERITGIAALRPWHRIPIVPPPSATVPPSLRPDYSVNASYSHVVRLWKYEAGSTIAAAPVLSGGKVFSVTQSGDVLCLSADKGNLHWKFKTGSPLYSSPAAANNRIVFGSTDSNIYCLSAEEGSLLWKKKTRGPIVAAPRIENGIVYIGGSDSSFRALSLQNGNVRWSYDSVKGFIETRPLLAQGKILFGAWDTYFYALNISDGSLAWKWTNGLASRGYSPAAAVPVASNGKVFIAAPDRAITAIDIISGKEIWRSKDQQVREEIGISENGKRIYAKSMNDTVFAFSAADTTKNILWKTNCRYGINFDASMIIEKNGIVFLGTKNGRVFALDGETGKILWQHRIGPTVVNTPAPVDAKRVIVSDFDGKIILLENQSR